MSAVAINPSYRLSDSGIPGREGSSSSPQTSAQKTGSDEFALISKLSSVDTKVRAHEAAHIAAGSGVVTGGANFSYAKGPDGKMYATGGEVPIDTSEGKTPQETIQKARQIVAAAMAPADPSPQDYKVAATAAMMEMRAHLEEAKKLQKSLDGHSTYLGMVSSGLQTPEF